MDPKFRTLYPSKDDALKQLISSEQYLQIYKEQLGKDGWPTNNKGFDMLQFWPAFSATLLPLWASELHAFEKCKSDEAGLSSEGYKAKCQKTKHGAASSRSRSMREKMDTEPLKSESSKGRHCKTDSEAVNREGLEVYAIDKICGSTTNGFWNGVGRVSQSSGLASMEIRHRSLIEGSRCWAKIASTSNYQTFALLVFVL